MKKSILEAAAISLMVMTFVVPSVLAMDYGPTWQSYPVGGGDYGEYVTAGIGANVDGSGRFDEAYWYAGRTLGDAQGFCGYLWWHFYYDSSNYIEWYSSGTSYGNMGPIDPSTYVASHVWSWFYDSELYEWKWEKLIDLS
jgi:hypothetical protein